MPPALDIDSVAIAIRLGAALLAGAILGIDREIHRKPAGMRTHALVSLGAAIVMLSMIVPSRGDADAVSRAVQGIITGIGFVGGGVILQREAEGRVEGLTTAASIWVAAGLGIACGAGLMELVAIALAGAVILLTAGNWVERFLQRRFSPPAIVEAEKD